MCVGGGLFLSGFVIGDGPNTVSESTVSNTELSEFLTLTEFRGRELSESSQPLFV